MTVSHAEPGRWGLLLAAALVILPSLDAFAQQGRPRQLVPPGGAPAQPGGLTVPGALPGTPTGTPRGIREVTLPEIDVESVGVLDPQNGGLGVDMWAGSDRMLIDALLPRLPAGTRSPAMRSLMRRLLLSVATAPKSVETFAAGPAGAPQSSLLGGRVERLLAMGDFKGVDDLARLAGDRAVDPLLAKAHVDALLLSGDRKAACAQTRKSIRRSPTRYLQKALIFCQKLAGEDAAAGLGLSLMRDEFPAASPAEEAADSRFHTLLSRIGRKKPGKPPKGLANLTPLDLAMLDAARLPFPAEVARGANPAILTAVADNAAAKRSLRISAAEVAVAAGALDAEYLRKLYMERPAKNLKPERVLKLKAAKYGPLQRATFQQSAAGVGDPGSRARLLKMALERAAANDLYRPTAAVSAPLILDLKPVPEAAWFAAAASRALYSAGHTTVGRAWFRLLRAAAPPGSAGDRTVTELWPLVQLGDAFVPLPNDPTRLMAWREIQRAERPKEAERRTALLLALMDGLEVPVQGIDLMSMLDWPRREAMAMSGATPWRLMASASAAGRRGETVLVTLVTLGELSGADGDAVTGNLGLVNPYVLRESLIALRRIGLVDEARALAFDAAIAAGF